ncbi:hypothetical protein [Achromobacter sp. Marseille-Q4962]|uniref:hypothetical protein n=1 Tax=Achromobacter sp. Marseille-Q4962 TaxID=2942202 RepID=UPI002074A25B|nr:hypothetical protein [Achromobacter sp. Marseille-Q4962]
MNAHDLDQVYTQLARTLTRVGETRAPLFLSILSLSLLARQTDTAEALALLAQAEAATRAGESAARPAAAEGVAN